jgi:hypothetical protein
MLPDFATMIGARVPSASHDELAAGIAFHHETDGVFHQAPTFVELQRRARIDLRERGLSRGSALAVAHIGVEILLDTFLAREEDARLAYLEALALGGGDGVARHINWCSGGEPMRYEVLRCTLAKRGISADHTDPETVTFRLERALSGRPRLALRPSDLTEVTTWAQRTAVEVELYSDQLVREVRLGLKL